MQRFAESLRLPTGVKNMEAPLIFATIASESLLLSSNLTPSSLSRTKIEQHYKHRPEVECGQFYDNKYQHVVMRMLYQYSNLALFCVFHFHCIML